MNIHSAAIFFCILIWFCLFIMLGVYRYMDYYALKTLTKKEDEAQFLRELKRNMEIEKGVYK